jgi:hypothetical protein
MHKELAEAKAAFELLHEKLNWHSGIEAYMINDGLINQCLYTTPIKLGDLMVNALREKVGHD